MKILIVDDNRDLADGLADILEVQDHEVTVAYSGEDAVVKSRQHFDLTFLDVKLPGMNGVEAFGEMRKHEPGAKVVMMTGFSFDQLLQQALDKGALRVLRKPFEIEEVLGTIRQVGADQAVQPEAHPGPR